MSDPRAEPRPPKRVGLVGATGLIGRRMIEITSEGDYARIVGIARREIELPKGARIEVFVADPSKWKEVLEAVRPRSLVCALGTRWRGGGDDEAGFRAAYQDVVLKSAQAAHEAGIRNFVLISSAGASVASKNFYLKIKGETEQEVTKVGFKRLDILRPGMLKGQWGHKQNPMETMVRVASPVIDPLLPSKMVMYRSIDADLVAEAALGLGLRKAQGRFTHDNDAIKRAAREWRTKAEAMAEAE